MKIAIGADHAGYQLKDSLKKLLDEMGVAYGDFGTSSGQSVDYPDFAKAVAEGVAGGKFDRGILVCGTGVGMAIAANKVSGVRSAPIVDTDTAKLSREHNDLNVLTLGARVLPESRAREIVRTFLKTPFEGGAGERVKKIHALAKILLPSRRAIRRAARRTRSCPSASARLSLRRHALPVTETRYSASSSSCRSLDQLRGHERFVRGPSLQIARSGRTDSAHRTLCRRHTSPSAFH